MNKERLRQDAKSCLNVLLKVLPQSNCRTSDLHHWTGVNSHLGSLGLRVAAKVLKYLGLPAQILEPVYVPC